MIPIGNTLVNYGITDSFSGYLASLSSVLDYVWMLVIIMVITMFLSDIINNAPNNSEFLVFEETVELPQGWSPNIWNRRSSSNQ